MNTGHLPKEIHERFTNEGIESGKEFIQGCRNLGFDPVAAAVSQREQGYFCGARSEYLRAQQLVQALEHIAKGTHKGETGYQFALRVQNIAIDVLQRYNKTTA